MIAAVIGMVSSGASIALRIADRKGKYIILTEILSLVGSIAVLAAICWEMSFLKRHFPYFML